MVRPEELYLFLHIPGCGQGYRQYSPVQHHIPDRGSDSGRGAGADVLQPEIQEGVKILQYGGDPAQVHVGGYRGVYRIYHFKSFLRHCQPGH